MTTARIPFPSAMSWSSYLVRKVFSWPSLDKVICQTVYKRHISSADIDLGMLSFPPMHPLLGEGNTWSEWLSPCTPQKRNRESGARMMEYRIFQIALYAAFQQCYMIYFDDYVSIWIFSVISCIFRLDNSYLCIWYVINNSNIYQAKKIQNGFFYFIYLFLNNCHHVPKKGNRERGARMKECRIFQIALHAAFQQWLVTWYISVVM